MKCKIGKF